MLSLAAMEKALIEKGEILPGLELQITDLQ